MGFEGDAIEVEIEAGEVGLLRGPSALEHLMTATLADEEEKEEEECLSNLGWVVIRMEGTEYAIDISLGFPSSLSDSEA